MTLLLLLLPLLRRSTNRCSIASLLPPWHRERPLTWAKHAHKLFKTVSALQARTGKAMAISFELISVQLQRQISTRISFQSKLLMSDNSCTKCMRYALYFATGFGQAIHGAEPLMSFRLNLSHHRVLSR